MLLRRVADGWSAPSLTNYGSEDDLQKLLADSPELIPGAAGTATARELWVPGVGALDIVCVGPDGDITLVECKLAANSEIRRTVVGQLFAYASGIRGMSYDEFAGQFAARAGESLVAAVKAAAGQEVNDAAFRSAVEDRLASGSFRLVFAVDAITSELRDIVEYLHLHLTDDVSVVALELGYLKLPAETELLVPTTYGAELAAEKTHSAGPAKKRWTRPEVEQAVAALEPIPIREFVTALLKHADAHGASFQGGTGQLPSAGVYYPLAQKRPSLWSLYVDEGDARVALNLGSISNVAPDAAQGVVSLMRADAHLRGPLPDDDAAAVSKYPTYSVAGLLAAGKSADSFVSLLDTALAPVPTSTAIS